MADKKPRTRIDPARYLEVVTRSRALNKLADELKAIAAAPMLEYDNTEASFASIDAEICRQEGEIRRLTPTTRTQPHRHP